ncbi:MAG: hypothetical protein C3F13_10045 [Anaerolineales bacterium]|nr:MAG: hypothetical protein C3F13_10045 [Anaerolineales bacterium]
MVKIYSVKEMLSLEKEADSSGLSYAMMMENAGKGLAGEIERAYSHHHNKTVLALVGSGNNGGDALVALQELARLNWETYAYIVKHREVDDPLVKKYEELHGCVTDIDHDPKLEKLSELLTNCGILIDGVFGTGIKLPLRGETAEVLAFCKKIIEIQDEKIQVVAVDCPSGVDCETGEVADQTIPADLTVTMAGLKTGLLRAPAEKIIGTLRIVSIGSLERLKTYTDNQKIVLDNASAKKILPQRPIDAHKGTFGTAFIVAGSINYTGAALLAGEAAYRAGVGLVTMAVPEPLHRILAGHFPESTWVILPHEMGVISEDAVRVVRQNIAKASAVLIGPGFGLEETTGVFMSRLFEESRPVYLGDFGYIQNKASEIDNQLFTQPVVIDADGLKLLARIEHWFEKLPALAVLTPHPGEMSILSGLPVNEIQANRLEIAEKYAKEWGHVLVLKGAYTVIAAPDGRIAVVPIATSALARAGTGDVLAGLIVGLRAQGAGAFEAACAGAWIHAQAGLSAADKLGTTASILARDVLNAVPSVISKL